MSNKPSMYKILFGHLLTNFENFIIFVKNAHLVFSYYN